MNTFLIKNATIIDGSGAPAYAGDLLVQEGRIAKITRHPEEISLSSRPVTRETVDAQALDSVEVFDATGQILSPGFIDSHAHSDLCIGADPEVAFLCKISQGVTTEINGQCGYSLFPVNPDLQVTLDVLGGFASPRIQKLLPKFREFRDYQAYGKEVGNVTNQRNLVGHCLLRSAVMGVENRRATPEELDAMKALLKTAMEQGAAGLSSGLVYIPGAYCDSEELIELCKVIAPYGGIYATHMRNEADDVVQSVADSIRIAREAGVRLVISHHKICGRKNWGTSETTLRMIEEANRLGGSVYLDMYPYHATMTSLDNCMPPHYFAEGIDALCEKLSDPAFRIQLKEEIQIDPASYDNPYLNTGGFHGILISVAPDTPEAVGKTVAEYAALLGKEEFDTYFDLLIANHFRCMASFFSLSEEEMLKIYRSPYAAVGSDTICRETPGPAHPRAYGSFVRPLADFVGKRGLLSLEEAIHKQTGLPADIWKLTDRGRIAEGLAADLVLFDPATLHDAADFEDGTRLAEGIRKVFVNGELVYTPEGLTGRKPGRFL